MLHMAGKIALIGMKFHAFHGHYAEEQSVGNDYEIDVVATLQSSLGSLDDDLSQTVNYEQVYEICRNEMACNRRLIETVLSNILHRLKAELSAECHFEVQVRKMNPLLGGFVAYAAVSDSA